MSDPRMNVPVLFGLRSDPRDVSGDVVHPCQGGEIEASLCPDDGFGRLVGSTDYSVGLRVLDHSGAEVAVIEIEVGLLCALADAAKATTRAAQRWERRNDRYKPRDDGLLDRIREFVSTGRIGCMSTKAGAGR